MGMLKISFEGTFSIVLGLFGLAGAGAIMIAPDHTEIGWGLIWIALTGLVWLGCHHFNLGQGRMLAATGMIVFGMAFLGCVAWYFWPKNNISTATAATKTKEDIGYGFYIECHRQFGPIKIPSDGLYFAMINETGGGGLGHLPVTDPSQEGQEYKILNDKLIETLQCKLSNYEALPAIDTVLNLTVLFTTVKRAGILVSEGEIVGRRNISLPIGQIFGKIDPGVANSFTFYVANRSEKSAISAVFPPTISARLLNEQKSRPFRLASNPTGFLLPERPFRP